MKNNDNVTSDCHEIVVKILNRGVSLSAISALDSALDRRIDAKNDHNGHEATVIAFDTNVFLKLNKHPRSADIIDFLRASFPGRLLLPGQVVQEFWNNQLNAVETLATSIRKHSENLKKEIEKVDSDYGEFAIRFQDLLDEFQTSYGYIYDDGTLRNIKLVVTLLSEKALVPYCRRTDLSPLAAIRRSTKTPPGFKDNLDGDFFVWADLLLGVATLQQEGFMPTRVALVTNDAKVDWSRNGIPHPILSAEMMALCGATFQIWSLDDLASIVPA